MSPSEICAIGQEMEPQGGCPSPLLLSSALAGHATCRYKAGKGGRAGAPHFASVKFGLKPVHISHD